MTAINFKARFAPLVESGEKRQTIRPERKQPIKVGDKLQLYTGMRTKGCRKLADAVCTQVRRVTIANAYFAIQHEEHPICDRLLGSIERFAMAVADGFDVYSEMHAFFKSQYGLPFRGVLIQWELLK